MYLSGLKIDELKAAVDVALEKRPADLVVLNGNLVNVCTGEIYQGGVAVSGKRIAKTGKVDHCIGTDTKVVDANGYYLVPGLLDTHIHIESSMLTMTRFAEAVLPHGTTSIVCDLHEVGIIAGLPGMREVVEEARTLPMKEWLTVPFNIPLAASEFETVGGRIDTPELLDMLTWPETVGWDELTVPTLLALDPEVIEKIQRSRMLGKVTDGPTGTIDEYEKVIPACILAGADYSHEGEWTPKGELEMLRNGMRVNFVEGGNVWMRNLGNQAKVVTELKVQSRHISYSTDDMSAEDIADRGHVDHYVRRAIEEGIDPVSAIQIGSVNGAELYRIDHLIGSIAPARYADILLVKKLEDFRVSTTIANGQIVAKDGKMVIELHPPQYSPILSDTVKLNRKISADDFLTRVEGDVNEVKVRTLLCDESIRGFTNGEATLGVKGGIVMADVKKDVLLISVVERYTGNGSVGSGFVSGVGLKEGAIATTVAHDHHNIVAIGANAEDMAFAANEVAAMHGGQVAVTNGKVREIIPLPIVGMMSDVDVQAMTKKIRSMKQTLNTMGCRLKNPFLHLSFFTGALWGWGWTSGPYNVTDKGWIHLEAQKVASPIITKHAK